MKIKFESKEVREQVVKRLVFLAYEGCGGPIGMGVLQARTSATEEEVWQQALGSKDYPINLNAHTPNQLYCDYVFGRCMKWGCSWNGAILTLKVEEYRPDYQSFAGVYPTTLMLLLAALTELEVTNYEIL